ncbi:MAG: lactate utilization protein [Candidatus Bipolaricaulota bacterium]|nr:lactate utilization protein [Candidatus Bipolaricaulota bacterium]
MSGLTDRFIDELERVAGKAQRVESPQQAVQSLLEVLRARQARVVALADCALARDLSLESALRGAGYELVSGREIARADVGISGADLAIAETGSLVLGGRMGDWELVTALPPVHVALVRTSQIVATLAEGFALCEQRLREAHQNFLFITGPSRTADIELTPVIGVHGPQELLVFVLDI